jgi:hypothetical protein
MAVAFVLDDLPDLLLERWYFVGDDIPHNVVVHSEVMEDTDKRLCRAG